ncbi:ParB/RepB/Spo0J family partition protein [Phenylobacterium sp. LjRoot219]|uniref:ParB/RepB/Spo0J family partition protein n=1 Tax=Phenylobacterium sp. LjRoot219 TaxID=3342283 RepID=UPI003ECD0E47
MASTTGKNRSILAGLVAGSGPAVTDTPTMEGREALAPAAGRLGDRLSTLARVTSGDIKEKTLYLVDPARCRMWTHHNRRYDLLSPSACAELLEGIRSQGGQEFPAIVRRVKDDPNFDYEVICGARRHWVVSYLRSVEHREIKFLIEERELNDEAAFRLADIENRARQDISDYERALDYLHALDAYYGGVSRRMAERLEMSAAWLSRFLDLGKMPEQIVAAFGDLRLLRSNHARELKPYLERHDQRARMLSEAHELARKQTASQAAGYGFLEAAKVVSALKAAAEGPKAAPAAEKAEPELVTSPSNAPLFTSVLKGRHRLVLELKLDSSASDDEFVDAFRQELAAKRSR